MRKNIILAAVAAFSLAACGPAAVHLRNPATGQTTQCGPYNVVGQGPNAADAAAMEQSRCLDDYRVQGFERVP
jgi:hypothetical protein